MGDKVGQKEGGDSAPHSVGLAANRECERLSRQVAWKKREGKGELRATHVPGSQGPHVTRDPHPQQLTMGRVYQLLGMRTCNVTEARMY